MVERAHLISNTCCYATTLVSRWVQKWLTYKSVWNKKALCFMTIMSRSPISLFLSAMLFVYLSSQLNVFGLSTKSSFLLIVFFSNSMHLYMYCNFTKDDCVKFKVSNRLCKEEEAVAISFSGLFKCMLHKKGCYFLSCAAHWPTSVTGIEWLFVWQSLCHRHKTLCFLAFHPTLGVGLQGFVDSSCAIVHLFILSAERQVHAPTNTQTRSSLQSSLI